jgi:hypothetical protein
MATLQDFFMALERVGVVDVLIPFILVFVIVFAVLQKTKILGTIGNTDKPNKSANVMIALVMGLAVVIPHVTGTYPQNRDVVNIINAALPNISVVVVAIVMLLLILGIWGKGVKVGETPLATVAVWIAIIAVVLIFGSAANWWHTPSWLDWLKNSDTQAMIIIVLVFAVIIWLVTREPKEDKPAEKKAKLGDVIVEK